MQKLNRATQIQPPARKEPARNWMQIDIAPLIAQQIYAKKPLPGTGRP